MGARNWIVGAIAFVCASLAAPAAAQAPLLDAMFQDHAVLQRERPIPVWGVAAPRARVTIVFNGRTISARANAAGQWRATLLATQAGGPYELVARAGGAEQRLADILVGDVWICSGQSNMELPVKRALNAESEAARATDDAIRLLTVSHAASPTPLDDFQSHVAWRVAAPDTVRDFSAACYFFARELKKTQSVPMGLIHSSWGGSNIETWISAPGFRAMHDETERLQLLAMHTRDPAAAMSAFGAMWERWWKTKAPGEPWREAAADWPAIPELRDFRTWGVPDLTAHNEALVWYRSDVTLTAAQAAQAASLSLGRIDEVDETWVNGRAVGDMFGFGTERTYQLPAGVLRAGENSIVVNVLNTWASGGMTGPVDRMKLRFVDGTEAPLAGPWRYKVAPFDIGRPPRAPWAAIGGITNLYNAMIAPIGPYALRGAVWYQGESNTGVADRYQAQLAGLMADWRTQFGASMPFLIVQLPNFGNPVTAPARAEWASLREAQRRAVAADAHAGLAVTIDVGDANELHPPNKQAVGARLARAARHVAYGEAISPSGPAPLSATREGERVLVRFGDVEGALLSYSGAPVGFELCGADQASCRFARAELRGDDAIALDTSGQTPTRVRFCWADAPICNLHDRSGLPAGPFELEIR